METHCKYYNVLLFCHIHLVHKIINISAHYEPCPCTSAFSHDNNTTRWMAVLVRSPLCKYINKYVIDDVTFDIHSWSDPIHSCFNI